VAQASEQKLWPTEKNSLGRLQLTGATWTGTGSSWSHHKQSTQCCSRKSRRNRQENIIPTQYLCGKSDNVSHHMHKPINKESYQTARASNRSKKGKANSHGATNQMTQAKAIKAVGNQ